jgi:hypothetical protein
MTWEQMHEDMDHLYNGDRVDSQGVLSICGAAKERCRLLLLILVSVGEE